MVNMDLLVAALRRATTDLNDLLEQNAAGSSNLHLGHNPAHEMQAYEDAFRVWLRINELRGVAAQLGIEVIGSDDLLSAKAAQASIWQLSLSSEARRRSAARHREQANWWRQFSDMIDPENPEFLEHLMRRDHLEDYLRLFDATGDSFFDFAESAVDIRSADIKYIHAVRAHRDGLMGFAAQLSTWMIRIPSRWWWYAEEIARGTFVAFLPDEIRTNRDSRGP
jgi:hypothetical protein